jgi:integrase
VQYLDKGTIKGLLAYKLSGGLSRNTVRILHATLRALLAAAVDDGVIPANPAEKLGRQLRLVLPKAVRQEEIKAMTREQRQFFILSAAQETPGYYPLFVTLAGTGMRLGEVLALQWDDVHLEARKISVGRSRRRRGTAAPSICLRGLPTSATGGAATGCAYARARMADDATVGRLYTRGHTHG